MAIRTRTIGLVPEEAGMATLSLDYDDADLRVRTLRIANTHPTLTARFVARRADGTGPVRTLDCPPGQTATLAVGTTTNQRLQLVVDARGRLDGVEYAFQWVI